ncbi:hypothetical protein HU200_004527 [Digitaria exilis]|uniref:Uncharacterized protein n=1 Tax=Digitaria exilis TaxID=1010633 RepID=A0A835KV02_9POAL|nr:hypothetical protein HU200_004527 [Digitaria exilis]
MADSSVNSNGNALPYYKEKKPSVHFSDRFTITSSDGSVHYDKEMLKRTMLVHEATFRKQVYELHRLYKTQKELMAQLQRKEFSCSPRYADALQPGSSASQRKEVGTDIRNLIDLNEALPIMDDPEMDACGSGELVPREPNDPSSDSLAIKAAENLVAICNVVVQPASPQVDTLHWFADLATSKENTTLDKDSDDDFEALTLKLQETKSNEYHSTPRATQEDNRHNGPCSAASLLIPKPQRGKGRGRRQRKDFHRDVLPCIASLQKNEVSEDLCALGRPKPVTPSKRGGRNGQQPRARRRVRRVAVAMAVEEAEVSPPPPSPSVALLTWMLMRLA